MTVQRDTQKADKVNVGGWAVGGGAGRGDACVKPTQKADMVRVGGVHGVNQVQA
jgi:hypothetical protein